MLMGGASIGLASPSHVSTEIDKFVATLYPEGSHYFWVINDSTTETQGEMILDINAVGPNQAEGSQTIRRFLLLLVKGQLMGAQSIPLGAQAECGPEEKEV